MNAWKEPKFKNETKFSFFILNLKKEHFHGLSQKPIILFLTMRRRLEWSECLLPAVITTIAERPHF